MATSVDKDALRAAYDEVRSDTSETNWAVFKYEGTTIIHEASGQNFEDLKSHFQESERAFAYLRIQAGDEMSKRMKFVLITFCGNEVGPMKRAKMSTDKSLVKEVLANFALEIQIESLEELNEEKIQEMVKKAGGANYGTGQ